MSVNKEDTLRQFCDVTGADEARSRFFLDSSNWQLEVALSSFYEHGGSADEPANPSAAPAPIPLSDSSDMDSPPGSPLAQKKDKKKQPTNQRFATLGSLQQQESSSDEDEGQAFYAGGSERSGQQILGPPGKSRKDIVTEMFKSVRERGAVVFEDEPSTASRGRGAFSGVGYRLGQTADDHEPVATGNQQASDGAGARSVRLRLYREGFTVDDGALRHYTDPENAEFLGCIRRGLYREGFTVDDGALRHYTDPENAEFLGCIRRGLYREGFTVDDGALRQYTDPENAEFLGCIRREEGDPKWQHNGEVTFVCLSLYREGFTVDDGALRHYTDPENAEFLGCIRRGEIPPELSGGGGEVRVSLEDRRHEECPRQGSRTQAFQGKGHMLGSPTPPTVGATAPVAADVNDRAANQRAAQAAVGLDTSKPTTTIQFRLADGSRLTGQFNHTHTVNDLALYVSRAEPAYQLLHFTLLSSFPSRELSDPQKTLQEANLLNSTVLQRLK
ncbi:SEP domain-containing protein [Phthorimaea operculella]|nr:SEP domain-containing protein [Phthorimaea operculella]